MNRLILLAFAAHSFCGAAVIADDYLLRLDTNSYVHEAASDKEPKETVLRSIEVIARSKSKFHSRAKIGKESMTLAGKLCPADDGGFTVHITYIHLLDTGTVVQREDGSRQSLPETTRVETKITITEGGSITIGVLDTTREELGKPRHKSRNRYVLTLVKYESEDR